jgi:hypothetical protein
MPSQKDSVKNVIQTLEAIRGAELDPEEYSEIDEWNKGRALTQMVVLPGWQVILEMLASYAADSSRRLNATDPKNRDEVLAEHAVTFAATRIYHNFVNDVASAIEKARATPTVIKDGLRKVSPAPPESML